jgi:ribosomal protein L11 methyltransferase
VIRLAVRVRRAQAELVLAELLELAPAGVEEVALGGEEVEYAVYGAPGELPALPDVRAAAGGALVEVSTSEVRDDWQERWRQFHRAVLIEPPASARGAVPALRVGPPWEAPADLGEEPDAAGAATREIVIDPGQAFGTGAHATTRLCLELMLELAAAEPPRGALLDVGTGSGVLAIAGALLGYAPVLGLDNEQESVQAARANAAVNGVTIEARRFDLRTNGLPDLDGDAAPVPRLLTANLLRPLLMALAATLEQPPAHLIAGGLLAGEADGVAAEFARRGLRERARRTSGEWAALWLAAG